jgi:ribosomal 30S subunit maturation factor RimM
VYNIKKDKHGNEYLLPAVKDVVRSVNLEKAAQMVK